MALEHELTSGALAAGSPARPALSLILCSRNDQYMGNSRWRLQTALNYVARRAEEVGCLHRIEILVADWGSDVPLRDVVQLTPPAAEVTRFLTIPPAVAKRLQRDSPFAEVLALNAAARRAQGSYIGRVDQDTLVGDRFLREFFEMVDGRRALDVPLERALLYANRRDIPYRFSVQCPPLAQVEQFVRWFGRRLSVPAIADRPYWTYWVGIWLAHRDLWDECAGYDERLVYYNWMEVDMIGRLASRYPLTDLGALVGYDFYHLEHVHPWRRERRHVVKNPDMDWTLPPAHFKPAGSSWGLSDWNLHAGPATQVPRPAVGGSHGAIGLVPRLAWSACRFAADVTVTVARREADRWSGRARRAWIAVRALPITSWPKVLAELWASRKNA